MDDDDEDGIKPLWTYVIIPFIAGAVGYVTNVVALQMTFFPIQYCGLSLYRLPNEPWGLFGWQGIIPTKAKKMASICFDLFTEKLFNVQEVFRRLDPERFSAVMEQPLLLLMDQIVNETAERYIPTTWSTIPQDVKDDIVLSADAEGRTFLTQFMADMQDHVNDIVDIKAMTVRKCVEHKELIVQIFQEVGEKEFVFIRQSGFYFGFMFGLFQMVVYFFVDAGWVLPVAGFLVGWFTNFLALKVIFSPIEPRMVCGFKLQGLFLRRQPEVSEIFARIVMNEILHVPAIWEAVLHGPLSKNFYAMLRAHTLVFVDRMLAEGTPIIIATLGDDQYAQMKEDIAQRVCKTLPDIIDHSYVYTHEALDMENSVREKMTELSSKEFEGVL